MCVELFSNLVENVTLLFLCRAVIPNCLKGFLLYSFPLPRIPHFAHVVYSPERKICFPFPIGHLCLHFKCTFLREGGGDSNAELNEVCYRDHPLTPGFRSRPVSGRLREFFSGAGSSSGSCTFFKVFKFVQNN